jgi:CRISPR-associated protein Csd1
MMFAALNHYYDRLLDQPDPDSGRLKVPLFGYSDEKVGCVLVISGEGELIDVIPRLDSSGGRSRPRQMSVPRPEKRTSGIKPNFLWDKSAYVLGVQANPDQIMSNQIPWVEATKPFEAFKQHHIEILDNNEDEGLRALVKFLQWWQPCRIDQAPCSHDMLHTNLAFQLDGDRCYLHERKAAKELWANLLGESNQAEKRHCLVTGKRESIARLHPSIKGVYGGQSSGGSIVSFNAASFGSYGKEKGDNAPISEVAAFKYTTVLNYLLNRDNRHCVTAGDASTVFWAVAADHHQAQLSEQLFMQIVSPSDEGEAAQLRPLVEQLSQGSPLAEISPDIDSSTRFYLLGLAPNASRISIRFWLDSSFGELAERIGEHFNDLALDPPPWSKPPSIYRLLIQLVPHRNGQLPKAEEIPANLAGELMRSVLTGARYPHHLLVQLLLRIRCDGHISPLRIGLIKAVLQRDYRKNVLKEKIPMSLDENSGNDAYQLGRLFAVLERIQSAAIKDANATITDRYFGSASTVPYSVFPRLLTGSKNHLAKIRKNMPSYAVNLDKDLASIIAKLPPSFPKHFSIESQGRFAIGYYQQRESYFSSSKYDSDQTSVDAVTN